VLPLQVSLHKLADEGLPDGPVCYKPDGMWCLKEVAALLEALVQHCTRPGG
jgi:hypothetical protein